MTTRATTPQPAATSGAETVFVKWKSPEEELTGLAALLFALTASGAHRAENLCLAVANRNWAVQLQRACTQVDVRTSICMAPARLKDDARLALAKLDAIAHPQSAEAQSTLQGLGVSEEQAAKLVSTYAGARSFALARVLGLSGMPVFANALLHVTGEEDAGGLQAVLLEQLRRPTPPADSPLSPIVDFRHIPGTYDWVFLVGCVDGLMPSPAALEDPDLQRRGARRAAEQEAFVQAPGHARRTCVFSAFSKIDAALAQQAHIHTTRTKLEHGTRMGLCAPSSFLEAFGDARPSTTGGQAFLRSYNLN